MPINPPMDPSDTLDRANSDVVLIVDDVPDNLSVLHDALDESGYTVLVALDGASALDRAAQALPDVILLDALMPGLDGFEVARRLKVPYLDTGAMYRAVTWLALQRGLPLGDGAPLGELADANPVTFDERGRVFIGGTDVTASIRKSHPVGNNQTKTSVKKSLLQPMIL